MTLMLGLHWIVTNLGPICELKNTEFLGLVSSHSIIIVKSQASVYINWHTSKKKCIIGLIKRVTYDRTMTG